MNHDSQCACHVGGTCSQTNQTEEFNMGRRVKWLNVDLVELEKLGAENFVGLTPEQVKAYLLGLAKAQQ